MPDPDSSAVPQRSADTAGATFECDVRTSGHAAVWVDPCGELDTTSSGSLEATLNRALAAARLVVLDLRRLSFIDSSGAHVIDRVATRAREHQRRLVIVRGRANVDRLLTTAGLTGRVEIVDLGPVIAQVTGAQPPAEAP